MASGGSAPGLGGGGPFIIMLGKGCVVWFLLLGLAASAGRCRTQHVSMTKTGRVDGVVHATGELS